MTDSTAETGRYALGLDYGTQSVRAIVVDVATGTEIGTGVFEYPSGKNGILVDPDRPHLARQNPADYLEGLEKSTARALAEAETHDAFSREQVIGIGVDTTGSTPMPVDKEGTPLALHDAFSDELSAHVWLWKDHTGHAEAEEITETARKLRPEYLAKCGGTYSSEWYWSKILHCLRTAPQTYEAAHTWIEHIDWIPAVLTGTDHPDTLKRSVCAAGHKAMYNEEWGGYPDAEFLAELDERLVELRETLPEETYDASEAAGTLTEEWSERLGLPTGIPVAVGAFDAHLGAVGAGIETNTLVKIIGTSTCDLMITPIERDLADIPGLCGIVPGSVMPEHYGLEAGQSAVGDIFDWFVRVVKPDGMSHDELTEGAKELAPGESGLLGLDWHNGNRTVLVDQRLTGMLMGMTLHTTPAEIYRALVESTAFGARVIMERYEEYGVEVERIVNCGGISDKNPMVMQIYADVLGRPLRISSSSQTPALGAAISGTVVAGGHPDFDAAIDAMTSTKDVVFEPDPAHRKIYDRLYDLYRRVHDAFGVKGTEDDLYDVMKTLLDIRDKVRS
ncbi:ribulokinase [Longimonas halophila]|uniref:Ribulokinase n=1 Tax=Longimonas halophila TaxID=1469170 RepID=A0A2H3P7T9_9BACT|nr:ribulokinase [Longimonas halophila]PEN08718.1 ribulokinase [Longimonas halophila]